MPEEEFLFEIVDYLLGEKAFFSVLEGYYDHVFGIATRELGGHGTHNFNCSQIAIKGNPYDFIERLKSELAKDKALEKDIHRILKVFKKSPYH